MKRNHKAFIATLSVLSVGHRSANGFVPSALSTDPHRFGCCKKYVFGEGRDLGRVPVSLLAVGAEDSEGSKDIDAVEEGPGSANAIVDESTDAIAAADERERLKRSLIKLAAAYDRGYGATASSRGKVDDVIDRLEALNPTTDAAKGIAGDGLEEAPLAGVWRMCWTTAQDVLTLASSPLATIGSIYQVIEPPIATNIIDFIPRAQALFPPGVAPPTLLRAEVTTRASPREGKPLRVGLDFEAVKLKPVELLGFATEGVLPPLSFNLPRINVKDIPGVDPNNAPGYFDVAYLDDEMLIIKQNAPGGLFVLLKADSYDP